MESKVEKIAFIGVGNLGLPMSINLMKAGHPVVAYDISAAQLDKAVLAGAERGASAADAASKASIVITMVPSGVELRKACLEEGIIKAARPQSLIIDCSTVDIE